MDVSAGFRSPDGGDVFTASADVTWDSNLTVTVSNVSYSTSASCKWRVKESVSGTVVAGTDYSDSFSATEGTRYVFQACVAGPGAWGNSTDGSSHFTVTNDSSSGGDSGDSSSEGCLLYIYPDEATEIRVTHSVVGDVSNGDFVPMAGGMTVVVSPLDGYEITEVTFSDYIRIASTTENDDGSITYTAAVMWHGETITIISTGAVKKYTLTVVAGTGSSITVNRTSSPKKGATTGNLSNGATIYYSDVLKITFSAATGYEIATHTVNDSAFTSGSTHTVTAAVKVVSTANILGLVYIDNGVSFEAYLVYIDNGTSWDQYIPYCDNGISWDMCY